LQTVYTVEAVSVVDNPLISKSKKNEELNQESVTLTAQPSLSKAHLRAMPTMEEGVQ
jgi:hypothetical protein